ncbi:hypothetical protein [Shewanella sp. Scap07]|nr:hypothetical protein [Shewanella sp. Scap07]
MLARWRTVHDRDVMAKRIGIYPQRVTEVLVHSPAAGITALSDMSIALL